MNYEEMAKQASEIADALRKVALDEDFSQDEFEAGVFYERCIRHHDLENQLADFLKDLAADIN